jgi:hypothetical protein
MTAMPDPDRARSAEVDDGEAELQAAREAWGPEWPWWLSGTGFPEPEAEI